MSKKKKIFLERVDWRNWLISFLIRIILVLILIMAIYLIRLNSPTELDDVSPGIPCDKELLEKSDILWVIPKYENIQITKEWCEEILSLNKELGMHGVVHTYNEFGEPLSEEYLQHGREIFKDCFGFYPEKFKPPQLNITSGNSRLINQDMILEGKFNQFFHKVYHCQDTGMFSNKFVDMF